MPVSLEVFLEYPRISNNDLKDDSSRMAFFQQARSNGKVEVPLETEPQTLSFAKPGFRPYEITASVDPESGNANFFVTPEGGETYEMEFGGQERTFAIMGYNNDKDSVLYAIITCYKEEKAVVPLSVESTQPQR